MILIIFGVYKQTQITYKKASSWIQRTDRRLPEVRAGELGSGDIVKTVKMYKLPVIRI